MRCETVAADVSSAERRSDEAVPAEAGKRRRDTDRIGRRSVASSGWATGLWTLAAVAGGVLLSGCQTMVPRSATTHPPVPIDGNAALAEYIADQPYVTVEPAYRAVYVLRHGEVFPGDFASLTEALKADRIARAEWNHPPDALLDRASAGYLICKAVRVRTGLNWQLTGLGRYAWRELNYLGIASPVSEYGYVPGGQFVGMLARAEEYMHRTRSEAGTPLELGSEP